MRLAQTAPTLLFLGNSSDRAEPPPRFVLHFSVVACSVDILGPLSRSRQLMLCNRAFCILFSSLLHIYKHAASRLRNVMNCIHSNCARGNPRGSPCCKAGGTAARLVGETPLIAKTDSV